MGLGYSGLGKVVKSRTCRICKKKRYDPHEIDGKMVWICPNCGHIKDLENAVGKKNNVSLRYQLIREHRARYKEMKKKGWVK